MSDLTIRFNSMRYSFRSALSFAKSAKTSLRCERDKLQLAERVMVIFIMHVDRGCLWIVKRTV